MKASKFISSEAGKAFEMQDLSKRERVLNDSSCSFITTMNMPHPLPGGVWVLVVFQGPLDRPLFSLIRSLNEGQRKGRLSIDFLLTAFYKMFFFMRLGWTEMSQREDL